VPLIASLLFFLSGALGLGYQLVWVKKSALLVGSSQIALSTVLTSFFLGLGLGSLFVGRYLRSRRWSPLYMYGLFEVAIGIFALAFPLLFEATSWIYVVLHPFAQSSGLGLMLLRFLLLFLLFLVPTFFMGGTLPLLLDGLVSRDESIGPLTSRLYGINILGAVAGVLATGYWLIPEFGMTRTSLLAGCGNLMIGAVALVAFRGERPIHEAAPQPLRDGRGLFFPTLAFLSGFAAIGYQVIWARYFSLFQNSTVYFIGLLLAVYLLALAVGSLISSLLLALKVRPLRALAYVQPAVPLALLLCLRAWTAARLPPVHGPDFAFHAEWAFSSETLDAILVAPMAQIALVIFVPVAMLGTGLPMLIAAATRHSDELRRSSGSLVFWNTLGSSAGGFAVGYLLIPNSGLTGAIFFAGLISIALGVASEWHLKRGTEDEDEQESSSARRRLPIGFIAGGLSLLLFVRFLPWNFSEAVISAYGWGASTDPPRELIEVVDGPLTTAWVLREPDGVRIGSGNVSLAHAMFFSPSAQMVQGHLPVLFYPRSGVPRRALGIALGSGQTFGALLRYPVEHVDVVDISSEMVQLSFKHFGAFNNGLSEDPRVQVHLDDGRHFVARAPSESYDVLTMEPPPPTHDGVFSLYSLEFYQQVERILGDGGVFLQWLPLYLVSPDDVRGMLHTQASVFPQTFVMIFGDRDFAIVSFKGERPIFRREWIEERSRGFAEDRNITGVAWHPSCEFELVEPESVMAMILTGPESIAAMDTDIVHREDDQRLAYSSGDREVFRRYKHNGVARLSFAAVPITPFEDLQIYFDSPIDVAALEEQRACSLHAFDVASPAELLEQTRTFERSAAPAVRAATAIGIARAHARSLHLEPALLWLGRAMEARPDEDRPALLRQARGVVRAHAAIHDDEIERWLTALPEPSRSSPLAGAMRSELRDVRAEGDRWDSRYLLRD